LIGTSSFPWNIEPSVRRRFENKCYIPLPDEDRRKEIIKASIGNSFNIEFIEEISKASESFSVSDLEITLKDAEMEPVRRCLNSTHFKKIQVNSLKDDFMFTPCSHDDLEAVEISLDQIPQNKLHCQIEKEDVSNSFSKAKRTITEEEIEKFEKFISEFDDL
jgi:vacuolar protein-sorting-associated protein 4